MSPTIDLVRLADRRIRTRCQSCQVEILLDPDGEPIEPDTLAARYALGIAANALVCNECGDKADAADARVQSSKSLGRRLDKSKLPKPFREFEFGSMFSDGDRARAIQAAREWADGGGQLVLHGPAGVGKTRLAGTAAKQRITSGNLVSWCSVAVLIAQLGASFSDGDRREAIKVLTGDDGLVLDDFDKVNPTEWARNQLFAAVDRRLQANAPLLVTTNLKPSALREKFGEPIASRLAGCRVVELMGPDHRLTLDTTL